MQEILTRLKSPVVLIQLISILAGVIVFFAPNTAETVKYIVGAVVAVINIFAGLNNPTDKINF